MRGFVRAVWKDPATERHGQQGQPQAGWTFTDARTGRTTRVFSVKRRKSGLPRSSRPRKSTKRSRRRKSWQPGLKHFIIATTAPNEKTVQAHVRAITEAHKKKKMFSVSVASWNEITRRLAGYPELLRGYGYLPDLSHLAVNRRGVRTPIGAGVTPHNPQIRKSAFRRALGVKVRSVFTNGIGPGHLPRA